VRKVIRTGGAAAPPVRRRRKQPTKLSAYEGYLKQRIGEGVLNTRKLLRELRERGYHGGLTQLILFVQPYRTSREEGAVVRYETQPGQQGQVDWSSFGYIIEKGQQRRLYAFVITLSYSRMLYVEFTTSMDISTWLRCHQHAFEYFGGVPRELLHDNLKTAVLSRGAGGKIHWNPRYLDFALYYGFTPQPCKPYRAQTKGKVERSIGYVRQNFWVGTHFSDLDDLNRQVLSWLAEVANVRIHGTTGMQPVGRWSQEALPPLPGQRFDTSLITHRRASRDCTLSYRGNIYSVPAAHAGQMLLLKETEDRRLLIYTAEQILVAEHRIPNGRHLRLLLDEHYAGLPKAATRPATIAATGARQVQPTLLELAVFVPVVEVRPLSIYAQLVEDDHEQG